MVTLIKVNGRIIDRSVIGPNEVDVLCAISNCPGVKVGGAWRDLANVGDKDDEKLRRIPRILCPRPHKPAA